MTSVTDDREDAQSHISAIHAGSLRSQVGRALEAALVSGELQPGVVYSAMLDLVKDGFVEVARNKGFRVLEMSEDDLDQVFQIRLLLEVPSTARAAAVVTEESFATLSKLADEITAAAREGDVIRYLDADRRFHVELISALGNPRLTDLVDRLRRQTRLFGLDALARSGRLTVSAEEHHALLTSLRSGDGAAATRLMTAHIGHTRGLWAGREESQEASSVTAPTP
jgi:DNA-binding GntR family transcriptional regulator